MHILSWVIFGLIVGAIAKYSHPGEEPEGYLPTIAIGIAGSFLGGLVNSLLFSGGSFRPAGLIMSIVGGIVSCAIWRWYKSQI